MLAGALALALSGCGNAPDNPGGPGRAAPKTSLSAPTAPAADPGGIMLIPASPVESEPPLVRRPVRIWV